MEAAPAGSLLGLKIELCSTFSAESSGKGGRGEKIGSQRWKKLTRSLRDVHTTGNYVGDTVATTELPLSL